VAEQTLKHGGAFVTKIFVGGDFPIFKKELQARFDKVHIVRPQATREHSYECFLIGLGFKQGPVVRAAGR
jgi:23S rRNA (uridine2552-2'-O)-methyltransferase